MIIHLVHGIHTEGPGPISALRSFLTGFDVRDPDYGYIYGIETRFINPPIVGALKPYIGPEDIVIAHSNGCAIAYDLMSQGVRMGGAIFINAALQQDILRPSWVPWIDVYYNAGDEITEAARIAAQFGLADPCWGEMGHGGYLGPDKMIGNIDCGATRNMPIVFGHSDYFTPSKISAWGPYTIDRMRDKLSSKTAGAM